MEGSQKMAYLPHNRLVLISIKLLFATWLIFFFAIPAALKAFPAILIHVAFLNHLRWPLFVNLSDPMSLQLNRTSYFQVKTSYQSTIGAWHVMSDNDDTVSSEFKSISESLKSAEKVILYLHGNAGTRAGWHRIQLYKVLSKLGLSIITFDYRGYGDSEGYPSEDGLVEDSLTMFNFIRESTNAPLYIWGHSLGTGVAVKLAMQLNSNGIKFNGLILESPFSNFVDASNNHPFSLPFRFMPWFSWAFTEGLKKVGIEFESDTNIARVETDTLILHAKDDAIVPYKLGVKLYETALKTKKIGSVELISFDAEHGYGHKHIHKAPQLPDIIKKFLERKVKK